MSNWINIKSPDARPAHCMKHEIQEIQSTNRSCCWKPCLWQCWLNNTAKTPFVQDEGEKIKIEVRASKGLNKNVHLALLNVFQALIHVLGDLLPNADAQLPLQLLRDSDLVRQHVPQGLDLLLHLGHAVSSTSSWNS